jgi:hypothetical protein
MDWSKASGAWPEEAGAPAAWRTRRGLRRRARASLGWVLAGLLCAGPVRAVTLEELQQDPKLTPKRFASHFSDFEYRFFAEVQRPELFLATRCGDCDDYAILADTVLRPKGYETRLIHVRMPGMVAHVVCYVTQEKGYLDFNNRVYLNRIARSGPSIREIATKVARSLSANWTSASEFTYTQGLKRIVATVVKTDPPENDPVPGKPGGKVKSDV